MLDFLKKSKYSVNKELTKTEKNFVKHIIGKSQS